MCAHQKHFQVIVGAIEEFQQKSCFPCASLEISRLSGVEGQLSRYATDNGVKSHPGIC